MEYLVYLLPLAILLLCGSCSGSRSTWSPFQSDRVKAICAHMTEAEKKALIPHGIGTGLFVAIFFAGPLGFGMSFLRSRIFGLTGLALLAWVTLGVFLGSRLRRRGKELLCSTQWAKSQAIAPNSI